MIDVIPEPSPMLLTVKEVAALLQLSPRTVFRLRSAGKLPKSLEIGGSVRWHAAEVQAWINQGCPPREVPAEVFRSRAVSGDPSTTGKSPPTALEPPEPPATMTASCRHCFFVSPSGTMIMASIFKRGKGKTVPYTIQYTDHLGQRKTTKGFTDKGLTEQLAAKLESEARMRATGLVDVVAEKFAAIQQSPIGPLLEAFLETRAETSVGHVGKLRSRNQRIFDACGITKLADITIEGVEAAMRKLRKQHDLGPRTSNDYLIAITAFCNWCVKTKKLTANPLAGIERMNVAVDIRRKRRALSPEEFSLLVAATRSSLRWVQGFSGEERARIYLLSYYTGLRRKELGSLTPQSFRLDCEMPTLTIEAKNSKHRKEDVLPLHPELVKLLKQWVTGKHLNDPLFPELAKRRTFYMVQVDLKAAGIPYHTHEGYADFHAVGRHTHITQLLRNGATLPEAQKLARHADIKMTMRYTHFGLQDQAKAVALLPMPKADLPPALRMRCKSGGVERPPLSSAGIEETAEGGPNSQPEQGFGMICQPFAGDDKTQPGRCRRRIGFFHGCLNRTAFF